MSRPAMTFKQCCQAIVDNSKEKSLNYAVNYAKAGLVIAETDANSIKIQAKYIVINMTRWQGDLAKEVRTSLKWYGDNY